MTRDRLKDVQKKIEKESLILTGNETQCRQIDDVSGEPTTAKLEKNEKT